MLVTKTDKEIEQKLKNEMESRESFKELANTTRNSEDKQILEHAIKVYEGRISILNWLTT